MAESFFQLLKRERVRRRIYLARGDARSDVFDYSEMFYNPRRRHGSNGGISTVEFERRAGKSGLKVSTKAGAIHPVNDRWHAELHTMNPILLTLRGLPDWAQRVGLNAASGPAGKLAKALMSTDDECDCN